MGHIPEVGGGNIVQYPEEGTVIVTCKGDHTKLRYLTFYPSGVSTINCRVLYPESESNESSRGTTNKSTKAVI